MVSKALCDVIAMRLPVIAVLRPVLSPLLSVSCCLITPYIVMLWFKNDRVVATLTRAIVRIN